MKDRKDKKYFVFSIKKASECRFSRRNGHVGFVVNGYSILIGWYDSIYRTANP